MGQRRAHLRAVPDQPDVPDPLGAPDGYDAAQAEASLRRRSRAQIGRYMLSGHDMRQATIQAAIDARDEALKAGWSAAQADYLGVFVARVGAEWAAERLLKESVNR